MRPLFEHRLMSPPGGRTPAARCPPTVFNRTVHRWSVISLTFREPWVSLRPEDWIKLCVCRRLGFAVLFLHDIDIVHITCCHCGLSRRIRLCARPLMCGHKPDESGNGRKNICGLTHGRLCLLGLCWRAVFKEVEQLDEVRKFMLWAILIVLLLLWLVGFYGGFVTSSLIHLLLVAAVVVLLLNLLRQHRSPV